MATRPDLVNDMRSRLSPHVRPPYLRFPRRLPDLFEAYVLSIVLDAAMRVGANFIGLRDTRGNVARSTLFRTSPGPIFARPTHVARQFYTHALIEFPGSPRLEIHQGVYVLGRSRSIHECDVAVIEHREAEECRRNGTYPRSSKVLIAAECKHYARPLGISWSRGFLGLTSDIWVGNRFLVSNSPQTAVGLLGHHNRDWADLLEPAHAAEVDRFRSAIERAFIKYKARN